ncbi:MAG: MBL fold metallo-hydrolase [Gammaproteobacteria bacterium]
MELKILGADGTQCMGCASISALVDGRVLIDAGTGAHNLSMQEIDQIRDVLVTHSHLDHTGMLCFLAESRIGGPDICGLCVHSFPETADAIREGFLNNKIWPDFEKIKIEGKPLMSFKSFTPYKPIKFGELRATPFPVDHAGLPTAGFVLTSGIEEFVFISDIYKMPKKTLTFLNGLKKFRRMTIEVSFPEGKEDLAKSAGHLTPLLLEQILEHLPQVEDVFYCHVKPRYGMEIDAQIQNRFGKRVRALQTGMLFDV